MIPPHRILKKNETWQMIDNTLNIQGRIGFTSVKSTPQNRNLFCDSTPQNRNHPGDSTPQNWKTELGATSILLTVCLVKSTTKSSIFVFQLANIYFKFIWNLKVLNPQRCWIAYEAIEIGGWKVKQSNYRLSLLSSHG